MKTESALDQEIQAALNVDPSPEFVPRVLAHIAVSHESSKWSFGWTALAEGTMVAAVLMAIIMARPHPPAGPDISRTMSAAAAMLANAPSERQIAIPRKRGKRLGTHVTRVSKASIREPEMLISPAETAAMRRLFANPPAQRTEVPMATIDPQPLPEFTMTPMPLFDPRAVAAGDFPGVIQ